MFHPTCTFKGSPMPLTKTLNWGILLKNYLKLADDHSNQRGFAIL